MSEPNPEAKTYWEEHYGERERIWSGRVNVQLAAVVGELPVGRALDLGCGEGGDAVWLAERGWNVVAVDVSETALVRAAGEAEARGVLDRIDFQRHDLSDSFPGRNVRPRVCAVPALHRPTRASGHPAQGRGRRRTGWAAGRRRPRRPAAVLEEGAARPSVPQPRGSARRVGSSCGGVGPGTRRRHRKGRHRPRWRAIHLAGQSDGDAPQDLSPGGLSRRAADLVLIPALVVGNRASTTSFSTPCPGWWTDRCRSSRSGGRTSRSPVRCWSRRGSSPPPSRPR